LGDDAPGENMDKITWEDTYAIARALISRYPDISLKDVTLNDIYSWTISLPEFEDDLHLSNDSILMSIYTEWFEEVNPI
jgi:FeS assembly protein IscX